MTTKSAIPCVKLKDTPWVSPDEWIPVIGPLHDDTDFLDFDPMHYHIDFRYLSASVLQRMTDHFKVSDDINRLMGVVIGQEYVTEGPNFQDLPFEREMPTYASRQRNGDLLKHFCKLENAYCDYSIDLQNPICPHRGLPLKDLSPVDGVIVCPGHGLGWDAYTGKSVTRFRPTNAEQGRGANALPRVAHD